MLCQKVKELSNLKLWKGIDRAIPIANHNPPIKVGQLSHTTNSMHLLKTFITSQTKN